MFPYAYKLKKKQVSIRGRRHWDFRPICSSRCHKISKFNNKCTPTISERYH